MDASVAHRTSSQIEKLVTAARICGDEGRAHLSLNCF